MPGIGDLGSSESENESEEQQLNFSRSPESHAKKLVFAWQSRFDRQNKIAQNPEISLASQSTHLDPGQQLLRQSERHTKRKGLSIFSTENYKRICQEQQEALENNHKISLAKIAEIEPGENFFFKYKNMSMSSSSVSQALKTTE